MNSRKFAARENAFQALAATLCWQRQRLQCCQPRPKRESMTTVVQKQPLRQRRLDLRFGQVLGGRQPEYRRNEVREGPDPLHNADQGCAEPPIPSWPPLPPGSDQIRERDKILGTCFRILSTLLALRPFLGRHDATRRGSALASRGYSPECVEETVRKVSDVLVA
jgi:hypothetical protein